MAIFTLRQALDGQAITIGDLTLTNFIRRDVDINPTNVILETVAGDDPGLIVRTNSPLTSESNLSIWFEFRATAPDSIIDGATVTLSPITFETPDVGGSVQLGITQGGPNDNIHINTFVDNAAGAPDDLEDADTITGGPVNTFRFDYNLALLPEPGISATFTSSQIQFDLADETPTLPDGFDGLQYIASYTDLIAALGANRTAGEQHYLNFGQSEGRLADAFNETQYLKNYGDLQAAFGTNVNTATSHFITNGLNEGRNDDVVSPAQIDGLQYIASHADLIAAFGANAAAGQQHCAASGQGEGRVLDDFNETQYLANYGDLQAAFGSNTEAATQHFIQFGFLEGRNDFIV